TRSSTPDCGRVFTIASQPSLASCSAARSRTSTSSTPFYPSTNAPGRSLLRKNRCLPRTEVTSRKHTRIACWFRQLAETFFLTGNEIHVSASRDQNSLWMLAPASNSSHFPFYSVACLVIHIGAILVS